MVKTPRRALVIVHEPYGGPSLVGENLNARGYEIVEHLVTADLDEPNDSAPFPSLDGFDLVVVMGSTRSLTRKHEIDTWIHHELDLIRAAHADDMAIFGVCFGGQLIAEALGGSVEVAPITRIGYFEIEGDDNPAGPGPWLAWNHDRFEVPAEAQVLARTEHAAQLFRIGRSVGTQFHPEVTEAHVKTWIELTPSEYFAEHRINPDSLLVAVAENEPNNREQCRVLVNWFLDEVVTS